MAKKEHDHPQGFFEIRIFESWTMKILGILILLLIFAGPYLD